LKLFYLILESYSRVNQGPDDQL